jgi:hypothetical protein
MLPGAAHRGNTPFFMVGTLSREGQKFEIDKGQRKFIGRNALITGSMSTTGGPSTARIGSTRIRCPRISRTDDQVAWMKLLHGKSTCLPASLLYSVIYIWHDWRSAC